MCVHCAKPHESAHMNDHPSERHADSVKEPIDTRPELSPQARLNLTRKALVKQMRQGGSARDFERDNGHADSRDRNSRLGRSEGAYGSNTSKSDADDESLNDQDQDGKYGDPQRNTPINGTLRLLGHMAQRWWRHHPVHLALDIARPALDHYAAKKPYQLIAIAAGLGALTVITRPWRAVSATGLALAAFKSIKLPQIAMSLLSERPSKNLKNSHHTQGSQDSQAGSLKK